MINKVILVGRTTKDLDLRKTPNGTSTITFTLACNRIHKAAGQPEADFITCVVWGKNADNMARYVHKGDMVGVEGRIQTRSYDNQQGNRIYITEVVADSVQFLETKRNNDEQQQYGYSNPWSAPNF